MAMEGKIVKLTVIMNDLSVMGGNFKSKFKHTVCNDGTVTYLVYNAVGLPLETKKTSKSTEEVDAFFQTLVKDVNFFDWNSRYYSDACGGFRWEIDVQSDSGEHFNPHGYIKLPPNWNKFAALVAEFTGFPLYVTGE